MSSSKFIDEGRGLIIELPDGELLLDESFDVTNLLTFHAPGKHDQKSHGIDGRLVSKARAKDAETVRAVSTAMINQRLRDRRVPFAITDEDSRSLGSSHRALGSYTQSKGYASMNGVARGTYKTDDDLFKGTENARGIKAVEADIGHMDNAFTYAGVTNSESMTVFRTVDGSHAKRVRGGAQSGNRELVDDGFMSTTTSRAEGDAIANARSGSVLMQINVPAGKKSLAGDDQEQELIFPRGTRLTLTGVGDDGTVLAEMQ